MTRVVITGAGVVTAVAHTPEGLHRALCEGTPGVRSLSAFATSSLPCHLGAAVSLDDLQNELGARPVASIDRAGRLAIVAAARAMASAKFPDASARDTGLVLGTMFSGARTIGAFDRRAQSAGPECASPLEFANTVLNAAAGQTAIRLGLGGINSTLASGHTSGLQAIAYGTDLIASGRATRLLAGGVEELFEESYVGFCRTGLMCGTNGRPGHVPVPFDSERSGFALGEAAAFVVLEPEPAAASRQARVLAEVIGAASANDFEAIERGYCGRATIAKTIARSLAAANLTPNDIDAVSASANGSYAGDHEEAAAVALVFGNRVTLPAVTAIKSVTGETLGASGPLQIIGLVEAMRHSELPGIRALREAGDCPIAAALSRAPRPLRIRTALATSVSPDGGCCSIVIRSAGAHP